MQPTPAPGTEGGNGHAFQERSLTTHNRDRGTPRGATPPTPPGIRIRTTAVRLGLAWSAARTAGDRMQLLGELSSPTAGSGPDRGSRVRSRLAAGGKWIRTLSPARTGDGVEPALVPLLPKDVSPARARFWLSIRAGGRRTTRPACLLYDRLGTFLSAATYERIRTRWCVTVRGAAPAPSLRPAACRRSGSGSGRIAALPGMAASRPPP